MNLNDFNHELLPEWNENHPENFLQQLVFIKEQGLLTDPDIIFAFLAKNQKFNVYDSMTLSERTNIMEFCEFIRKQYAAANQTPYLFERLFQEENEHPANFLARVKTHYYLSRDCVRIPDDSNMAEVDKVTIRDHYIMGLHSFEVRESVRLNCTQYGNLVALTQQFSQSIEELKATADFSSNLKTTEENSSTPKRSSLERSYCLAERSSRSSSRLSRSPKQSSRSPTSRSLRRSSRLSRQWSSSPNRSSCSSKRQKKSTIKRSLHSRK